MLDPKTLDLTPDGSMAGQDVVLYERYVELVKSYRELHARYGVPVTSALRELTVKEKIAALYSRESVAVLVTLLYSASTPVERSDILAATGTAESAFGQHIKRARDEFDVSIRCVSSSRTYDAKTDTVVWRSYYELGADTRTWLDTILSDKAVAYGQDDDLVLTVLTALAKRPSDQPPLSPATIGTLCRIPLDYLPVFRIVIQRMVVNGLLSGAAGRAKRITEEGRARLRALECTTSKREG